MFIYEKLVDGARKLYASNKNIPSEADVKLTYKKADGSELELSRTALYYQRDNKFYMAKEGSKIPTEEDIEIGVFVGDEQIIGSVEINDVKDTEDETEVTEVVEDPEKETKSTTDTEPEETEEVTE